MRLKKIHSGLPDIFYSNGDLPEFQCAWSKCGIVFSNRDRLLNHVEQCRGLVHRFHSRCRKALKSDLTQSKEQFVKNARARFYHSQLSLIDQNEGDRIFEEYYEMFLPIFKN